MTEPASERFTFYNPATYRIRVKGKLRASWSDRLEGMTISLAAPDNGSFVTTLEGELADQAALAGVLSTLYGLHLPVLGVEFLSVD